MGLKGYRLWAMGQLDSNVQSPTATAAADAGGIAGVAGAVQFGLYGLGFMRP